VIQKIDSPNLKTVIGYTLIYTVMHRNFFSMLGQRLGLDGLCMHGITCMHAIIIGRDHTYVIQQPAALLACTTQQHKL
jgi:hypothetical protein